nr:hypothetical protein [uncultured Cohaesibacter sp.]
MSDPNDKKPQSPASSWSDPDRQTRDKANAGPVMEDPLAELDRIVSGGFGHETGQQSGASVSADDLRSLEEELIRELRGHQQDVGDLAPASPATRQAPQVDVPQDDSMVRPHPLSQNRPGVQAQPTVPAASRETQDPRGYVPEAPVYREPEVRAEPFETEARRSAPEPSVGNDATRSSGLDDWSSLFDDLGPAASSASTAGGRRDERIDPYPQEPTDRDDGLPTSGSYGQLSRRAAPKVDMREEEDAYQAADSESQAPDVVADDLRYAQPPKQPSYDKGSYAAAKPDYRSSLGADREPEVDQCGTIDPALVLQMLPRALCERLSCLLVGAINDIRKSLSPIL